jgi:hypothetical protein
VDEGVANTATASAGCGAPDKFGCSVKPKGEVVQGKGKKPTMSSTFDPVVSLLIIDDDLGSLELFSNALAQPGLEILTASDPENGLDIACSDGRNPYDGPVFL